MHHVVKKLCFSHNLQGLSFHLWFAVAMEVSTTTAMMLAVVVPSLLMVAKFLWDHVSALRFE